VLERHSATAAARASPPSHRGGGNGGAKRRRRAGRDGVPAMTPGTRLRRRRAHAILVCSLLALHLLGWRQSDILGYIEHQRDPAGVFKPMILWRADVAFLPSAPERYFRLAYSQRYIFE
jgi:hypothetical protein